MVVDLSTHNLAFACSLDSRQDQNADDISGCGFLMSTMPVARHLLQRGPPDPQVHSPPTPGAPIGHGE
jgi:hypothetical protein